MTRPRATSPPAASWARRRRPARARRRRRPAQLPVREEADRAAVGRPEGKLSARSVEGSAVAAPVAQRLDPEPSGGAVRRRCRPSGETATGADSSPVSSEGRLLRRQEKRVHRLRPVGARRGARWRAKPSAIEARAAAIACPGEAGRRPRRVATAGDVAEAPDVRSLRDPAQLPLRSPADCQRSSGSLARQVRTTRSSAGGDIGWTCEIGGGSSRRIAEMSEACARAGERLPARRHLVERRRRTRRCRCARRRPCPRAARAPCTGTSRGSCLPACRPCCVGQRGQARPVASPAPSPWRGRSRGA